MEMPKFQVKAFPHLRGGMGVERGRWEDVAEYIKDKKLTPATREDYEAVIQNKTSPAILRRFPLVGVFYGFFGSVHDEMACVDCIRRNTDDISPGMFRFDHRWLRDCRVVLRK